MPETTRRTELATVFLVVLVDLLGFGIVLPLLAFYGRRYDADPFTIGLLYSSYSFAQLIFSPLWGGLSDRIGRRPVMLISTMGSFLSYVLFALSQSLEMLFLSRIVAGVMGGNISAAQAYVSDVTTREDRARGMGLIGAAFGIGFVMGPALAAALIHPKVVSLAVALGQQDLAAWAAQNPYSMPGIFAAAMSLASFLMVLTRLPETVKPGAAPQSARLGVFSAEFWDTVFAGIQFPRRRTATLLFGCVALLSFAQSTLYGAFPLFCSEMLGLTDRQVGYQFAFMGLIAVFVQGGLIRRLVPAYGERRLFLTGCALMAAAFFAMPAALSPVALLAVLAVLSVGGSLTIPTLNSMVSKESESGRFGLTLGVSQSLAGMGRVAGPAWGGWMYGLVSERAFSFTALALMLAVMAGIEFLRRD